MNTRHMTGAAALGIFAAGLANAAPARPDIVLFVADDLSRQDIGAFGSPDARTPNIDALARDGLRFTQAFATSPTCTPSRSSLLTGDYPVRNGAHANHSVIRDGLITLPARLKQLGYRVVIAGKTDFGPRRLFPFEYLAGSTTWPGAKRGSLNADLQVDAVDRLLATRDRAVPLAVIVADYNAHVPWVPPKGYDPARLHLSPDFYDTPATRASRARYLTKVTAADDNVGRLRASVARHGGAANTLFLFFADQGALFPSGKWNLYDQGIATPMIASWPGHVAAGRRSDALVSLVDILPTLQQVAGGTPATDIDGRSFLPVLTGAADRFRAEVFAAHSGIRGGGQGRNAYPMRAIRTTRYKLIENLRSDLAFGNPISQTPPANPDTNYWPTWVAAAKTDPKAAALVRRFQQRPPLELYDLQADPYELRNLAADPAQARTVADLKGRLDAWRRAQGDPMDRALMPGEASDERFPYNTCPCTGADGRPVADPFDRAGADEDQ